MSSAITLAREYLSEAKLLQLATLGSSGQPWMCNVWYAYDSASDCLFFQSRRTRRHSLEILDDSRVAGAIVFGEQIGPGQTVRGITFEGVAKVLTDPDVITAAYERYVTRWPHVRDGLRAEQFMSDDGPGMYEVRLKRIVLFDEKNFPGDARQEIDLQ